MSFLRSKWVWRLLIFVVLLYLVYSIIFYSKIGPGDKVPEFHVSAPDGEVFHSKEEKGKPYLLHFWGYWCRICINEIPELNRLEELFGGELNIVAIHVGASNKDIKNIESLQSSQNIKYDVYLDSGNVADLFGVKMFPTSLLVDQKGVVIKKYVGGVRWVDNNYIEFIKRLVGGDVK